MLLAAVSPSAEVPSSTPPSDSVLWLRGDEAEPVIGGTLTAWPDRSPAATPVTVAVAPTVVTGVLNGQSVVRFAGAEYLTANGLAALFGGVNAPFSLFALVKCTSFAADRTVFSVGDSASAVSRVSARARTAVNTWGIIRRGVDNSQKQLSATSNSMDANTWSLLEITFDGSVANLYVNGRQIAIASGNLVSASSITANRCAVGALLNTAASAFFIGDIAEIITYDRAVTLEEIQATERYFADRYAIDISQSYFVASTGGADTNCGMDAASPLATIAHGFGRLGAIGGTLYLTAAESDPFRETFDLDVARPITFDSPDGVTPWHWYGTAKYVAGWASVGGGVWSQAVASDPTAPIFIPTIPNGDYFAILRAIGDSTTPAQGEYGYSGGVVYVRLPSDEDPNDHDLEISSVLAPVRVSNDRAAVLTVRNGVVRGGRTGCVVGSRTGFGGVTVCYNVTAEYGNNNFAIQPSGGLSAMLCNGCVSAWAGNDGFNLHNDAGDPSYMRLENCTSKFCGDEGASPHDSTVMEIVGGEYSDNGSAGITAIENATLRVSGGTVVARNTPDVLRPTEGGIAYLDDAAGYVEDVTVEDNNGPGLYVAAVGTVRVTGLTSSGNALPDHY